ncbi:MAG: OmpA family protein [Marinilabiliales bacterium]
MNKVYFLILIFICLSTALFSQEWSKYTKKADEAFNAYEYYTAIDLYEEAYKKIDSKRKDEKAYIKFQIAQCYRFMNNTRKAEYKYKSAIDKKYKDPVVYLYYADMLKVNEKYKEAEEQYKKYLEFVPDDTLGKLGVVSCHLAADWYENPTRYIIENLKDVNTKESDFAPAYSNADYTQMYFTSTRKGYHPVKINKVTGQNFTDIFYTNYTRKETWEEPMYLNDTINTVYDEGTPSLTKDGTTMYFVRCKIVHGEQLGCQIYVATRPPGGEWSSTQSIPIAEDSISVGQPSISADQCTLYFVTSGWERYSKGGRDIWMVTRESPGANWGKPVNLGEPINTKGNEMYPYIRENGDLYFASDGHPGMGGLDIFKAHKDSTGKWQIENMKYPINSSADDFAIVFKGEKEEGLFTSARKETTNMKDEDGNLINIRGKGSDDIYSFVLPPLEFSLRGIVMDSETEDPIEGAEVLLVGSDGTYVESKTDEKGKFKYPLKEGNDYLYIVKKEGYLKGKGNISTTNQEDSKKFRPSILLSPIGKPIEIENIFYEFGDWHLTDESKQALDQLVEILKNNGNVTIELSAHTDMVGNDQYNIELSQKRAESVVKYLIEHGIAADRLTAKGYGKTQPKVITKKLAEKYDFLKEGDVLSPEFIKKFEETEKAKEDADEDLIQQQIDIMNQLNRRTEFKVISTKYIPF